MNMKIRNLRPSLNTTLIIGFLICTALLLVFLSCTLVPFISNLLSENAIERTKETVLQSVNAVDLYVDSSLSTMHFATSLIPVNPETETDWHIQLNLLARSNSDITTLAFFNQQGECLYATRGAVRVGSAEICKRQWFSSALEREGTLTCFSRPYVQSIFADQHNYVITLSRAVTYMSGGSQQTGVMLMDVDYAGFLALTDNVKLGESGYAYVMDEDNVMIAHPRLQLIYANQASEDITAASSQIVGLTRDQQQGRARVLIIATLSQTRWRMVGVAYIDEILQSQVAFFRIMSLALLCAAFIALGAASLMAYWVTRPITHLEHKMRKVEAGDLNVTITERGFREIRSVSTAFNHMLIRIRELMNQVVHEQEIKRLYELNALQAQISPHFLYNTLDSIIWMEERGRSREAITMVSALARLFRISISKGRSVISVAEEIEHVRNYVIIQKMRFQEKFECDIQAEDAALRERTVKLVLQPLVENALNHAIDEIEGATIHIVVRAFVTEDELRFTVADDGIGIPVEQLDGILTRVVGTSGIGLRNVNERIQLTYGKEYGLAVKSEEGKGTLVTIRMPRGKDATA
jgi:two-component system, sensor histidine kinase YesM